MCQFMPLEPLTEIALKIIDRRGKFALNDAQQQILQNKYNDRIFSEALKYYAQVIFPRVLPIFPALIYLSCKAVGGKPEKTRSLATAMLLVTASCDIHDDIIDKSPIKFRKKTVFGKYGPDIALLAGDALLIQGMAMVQNNCELLLEDQKKALLYLITKSMFELAEAEAVETRLWKKANVTPQECFEVIRHKGSVAELHCRLGGIVGCADKKALEDIADYGRVIGLLATMKDEFMDMLNFSELRHRIKNEMVPYPLLCALQNDVFRERIVPIVAKNSFSKKDLQFIVESTFDSVEVKNLKIELRELGEKELASNTLLNSKEKEKEAAILLQALAFEM